jgi:hypothetical protein
VRIGWILIAVALAGAPTRVRAGTADWTEVFAAERDTVVFMGSDGALLRAPFSLAARETLWTPTRGRHAVRVRVSPDGTRVAWIARGYDSDTSEVWVHGPRGTALRLRYFALKARQFGYVHSEPDVPSIEDTGIRGGRLIQAGPLLRRHASNTLEWTADSRSVVLGYDGGVAALPADHGAGLAVASACPVSLEALAPSPIFLLDAIVPRRTSPGPGSDSQERPTEEGTLESNSPSIDQFSLEHIGVIDLDRNVPTRAHLLLYPGRDRWRVFTASDLARSELITASPGTVWWAVQSTIRAIGVDDPGPTDVVRASRRIAWIGFDASRRSLLWIVGRQAWRKPEDGGPECLVLATGSPIRAAFASRTSRSVAIVTKDSLLVWDPADDEVRSFRLAGRLPCALFEGPGARLIVASGCGPRGRPRLARVDGTTRRLVEIETPRLKGGRLDAVGQGRWVLLYDPAPRPPRTLYAFDVSRGTWVLVENPGVAGWEPLARTE